MSDDAGGGPRRGPSEPGGRQPSRSPTGGGPGKSPRFAGGDSDAWAVVSYLVAGVGFWGFVGWLLDRWLDTSWLVMVGILVGFAGAFYLIIRRFGKS